MKSIACVECTREMGGKSSTERRYYISSLDAADGEGMLALIRGHWGVENQLHWSLDVTFGEDDSRVRTGHAAEHLSRFRRIALGLPNARPPSGLASNASGSAVPWITITCSRSSPHENAIAPGQPEPSLTPPGTPGQWPPHGESSEPLLTLSRTSK